MSKIAVVFGTYNRFRFLLDAVQSVRSQTVPSDLIIVDGGSTDGSREWLAAQQDVVMIGQRGPLTGAVRSFNLGFGYAVDVGYDYVVHFNDDAVFDSNDILERAERHLACHPQAGEVAFAFNLRGPFACEHVHGKVYGNFGMVRLEAGVAVARRQGDSSGRQWWNPIYRTYGADSEFGCWLWKLGWTVEAGLDLRVRDLNVQDTLRTLNNEGQKDSALFWSRWATKTLEPDV